MRCECRALNLTVTDPRIGAWANSRLLKFWHLCHPGKLKLRFKKRTDNKAVSSQEEVFLNVSDQFASLANKDPRDRAE